MNKTLHWVEHPPNPDGWTGACWGSREGEPPRCLHRFCPSSQFSVPLSSHHFNISSVISEFCGTKGKYRGLKIPNAFPPAQHSTPGPPPGGSFSLRRARCLLLASPHITTGQREVLQPRSHLLIDTLRMRRQKWGNVQFFPDLRVFLKATNNTKIYMASLQACSLREGNWISEGAEIAALSLQTLYSVEKSEQSQLSAGCPAKTGEHRICNATFWFEVALPTSCKMD